MAQMTHLEHSLELTTTLEDLLVREFRVCQNLYSLTREERLLLSKNDVQALMSLVERKEALLDELGRLEDLKSMTMQEMGTILGLDSKPVQSLTVGDIIAALDVDSASRLGNLRSGILALVDQVRDLTHGNRALATTALERADALQAFLLSFYQSPTGYRPQGVSIGGEQAVAWEIDHLA